MARPLFRRGGKNGSSGKKSGLPRLEKNYPTLLCPIDREKTKFVSFKRTEISESLASQVCNQITFLYRRTHLGLCFSATEPHQLLIVVH